MLCYFYSNFYFVVSSFYSFLFSCFLFFWFFFFLVFFLYVFFSGFCWLGSLFLEGDYNFFMFFLSSVFFFFVFVLESGFLVVFLSYLLLLISYFYFFTSSFLFFFFFFEISLLPILFMVLIFGSQIEKVKASYYILFYVFFTGLPFYFFFFFFEEDVVYVYLDEILSLELSFFLFFLFLMKFPIFFFHFWLPKVHVEASTIASMLLAGLLLKFGTMGFLRILGLLAYFNFVLFFFFSFLGMVICCFFCFFQSDVKSFVAYSSVVHMSFVLLVFLGGSVWGKFSSYLMMVSHGFVSFVIFYLVGEVYYILGSRLVYFFFGLFPLNFFYSFFFFFWFLLNSGFPFSLGFFSEFFGLMVTFFSFKLIIFFLLFYFFFSFYYCIYISIGVFMGDSLVYFFNFSLFVSFSCFFYVFSFFFFLVWAFILMENVTFS